MKEQKLSAEETDRFSVPPSALAELLGFVASGELSVSAAKVVFEEMVRSGRRAPEIVREKGLTRVSDEASLSAAIEAVLRDSPSQVAQYRAGKTATFGWLVGQAMKATGGSADPETLRRLLRERLDG
jgi:aspartyl-tRNA(Asn)/glutamyl-tRNA(Gln) amidotransferase subunit B